MSFQQVQQGWSQGTAAMQSIMRGALAVGRRTTSRRRSKRSAGAAVKKRKKRASSSGSRSRSSKPARLVKGSAAAKRYMASIRKKRR